MSDDELAARCKRNRFEEWFHASGCLVGLVCGIVATATVITLSIVGIIIGPGFFQATLLAFVTFFFTALSTYGLVNSVNSLARLRCRHALRELESRYGWRPLAEYVRAASKSATSTEIVVILKGRTLPICQNWWVCIRINGEQTGNVEARFGPILGDNRFFDFGSGHNPKGCFKTAKGELSPEAARRVAELAGKIKAREINVPSTVKDGFPVSCALILGATKQVKFVSCNLAGIPELQQGEAHVLLVKEVFSCARPLIEAPSGFGSTSFYGEIQIGDVCGLIPKSGDIARGLG